MLMGIITYRWKRSGTTGKRGNKLAIWPCRGSEAAFRIGHPPLVAIFEVFIFRIGIICTFNIRLFADQKCSTIKRYLRISGGSQHYLTNLDKFCCKKFSRLFLVQMLQIFVPLWTDEHFTLCKLKTKYILLCFVLYYHYRGHDMREICKF